MSCMSIIGKDEHPLLLLFVLCSWIQVQLCFMAFIRRYGYRCLKFFAIFNYIQFILFLLKSFIGRYGFSSIKLYISDGSQRVETVDNSVVFLPIPTRPLLFSPSYYYLDTFCQCPPIPFLPSHTLSLLRPLLYFRCIVVYLY